jgi:hypothetical protein
MPSRNEVVDNALEVVVEWQRGFDVPKFEIEILAHEREVKQVKSNRLEAETMDVSEKEQHCRGRSITHLPFPFFFFNDGPNLASSLT